VAAFRSTFGPAPRERDALEDPEDLEPYLAEAGQRHPVRPSPTRVERLRFLDDDTAEVEFVLGLLDGPAFPFDGRAVRRGNRWLVTRDTVVRVLQSAGVVVPPQPPAR